MNDRAPRVLLDGVYVALQFIGFDSSGTGLTTARFERRPSARQTPRPNEVETIEQFRWTPRLDAAVACRGSTEFKV